MAKTPRSIEVKIHADTTEPTTALKYQAKLAEELKREARRAVAYRDARHAIARYLIAHDVEYTRAYGAATDMLGEDRIDTIGRG